ncbi:pimeloyl-ACP methyl ester esterase BioH [Thalassomonas viridans]|uniref:Pimeloyl-[acyl-carrier protein] methyl ester esterase n=1 Tax=Thalassomonas viridans TaxID=137584 RepID=A0AAE9Z2H4_9GAMM|nr:pimeloyl-ACP methyl ester esterase BioH [Thalassomonas viridans]WDE05601.1 pimeloyl-ACP methyl ester esterase BioH [Thalassomonas viridans]
MAERLRITSRGAGTPLVFIHGWGFNSGIWQPLVKRLTDTFTVITVDLPGFGNNADRIPADYSLEAITDEVQVAVGQPAVYIGWSLGGLVATDIALKHPDKVLGLLTIASSPCFIEKAGWPGIKAKLLSGFHQQLSENIENTIESFLKIQAMGSPHLRQDLKEIHRLLMEYPLPGRQTLDDSLSLLETSDRRSWLADISCPFMRLYGRNDVLVPKGIYPLMEKLAPQSEVLVFDGASHAPFISHADEFYRQLHSWLVKHYH